MQQTYKLEATLGKPNPEVQIKLELKGNMINKCEKSLSKLIIVSNTDE